MESVHSDLKWIQGISISLDTKYQLCRWGCPLWKSKRRPILVDPVLSFHWDRTWGRYLMTSAAVLVDELFFHRFDAISACNNISRTLDSYLCSILNMVCYWTVGFRSEVPTVVDEHIGTFRQDASSTLDFSRWLLTVFSCREFQLDIL